LVSLADKAHNASAILRDYHVLGERLWERFNGGRAGTVWYYGARSEIFARSFPGPLADELHRSVSHFPAGDQADRGRTAWNAGIKQAS
jgi:hypothetical protein